MKIKYHHHQYANLKIDLVCHQINNLIQIVKNNYK